MYNLVVTSQKLKDKVNNLPHVPGVYIYRNSAGRVIYVGKAKDLKNRVKSYFAVELDPGTKTFKLVQQIEDMEYIEVFSELEALVLEAEMIKRYKPKYNIALKDDKSYLYIVIRKEKLKVGGKKRVLPKLLTVREGDIKETDVTYGPYPSANTAKFIVKAIRKALPYRDCSAGKYNRYQNLGRPCLYGHLGLCQAPCVSRISAEDYRKEIKKIERFLSGDSEKIINSLKKHMEKASGEQRFEDAAGFRDKLQKFEYVRRQYKSPEKYINNPYLVEDLLNKALDELLVNIEILDRLPKRIECYDISNISGKESTGSMVVSIDGRLKNSEYRRFKIKLKNEPDDFEMMYEVLKRRFKREKSKSKGRWGIPDLVVVDGGKGQVSAAIEALGELSIKVPVVGLAKKEELIVYMESGKFKEIMLSRDNEGLKLLQRLRDEAHRFARKYHHHLRMKKLKS